MIQNAQTLRAVAASMVVVHHVGSLYLARELGIGWSTIGAAGVDLFFVLSGFIMVYSTINSDRRPLPFLRRRIIRIVPLYALVTLLVWVLFQIGFEANGLREGADGTIGQLVKSLFFVPFERASGDIYPLVTVGWTLNYEMMFYVLFALSLALRHWVNPFHALLIALCVLVGVGLSLGGSAPLIVRFFLDPILLEFAAGMVIGLGYNRIATMQTDRAKRLGGALMIIGVAGLALTVVFGLQPTENHILRIAVWGMPSALIITGALMLERAGVLWNNPALMLQGDASYATYLVHMLVMQTCVKIIAFVLAPTSIILIVLIAVGLFVACLVAGTLLHVMVERPLTKLLRRDFVSRSRPMPYAR